MAKSPNHGGKRPGAGRPPKADEIKKIELMDSILAPAEVWQALAAKVQECDVSAIKCWIEHRHGKPKETVEKYTEKVNIPLITWKKDTTPE